MKILINGNTISLTQLMFQYNVQNQGGISMNSGTEFERTLNLKLLAQYQNELIFTMLVPTN
ncbi:hypothetical protein DGG96_00605 [Legionella qingyii]|uniref:Uncharacterized protein n=1 Tax=Legionella qingyii TaxID=2184757 RepID=A0A317UB98_9GAMM|nr:hypothetical protein [Legionella qingyii]PWY57630.1 hypothetical protein DGG96_00605 [Legionella qingyii]RUR25902.1 hypothetical protein ELY20_01785 [Legionella qingyii]RUR29292.1 hypothetical protein ELY16_00410 [Legionella qingyii]